MRIAVAYEKFATAQSGGARESLLTLLAGISDHRDITVDVYQTPPVDDPPETAYDYTINEKPLTTVPKLTWTDQVCTRFQWRRYFHSELDPETDLLWTQNQLAPASVAVAAEMDIPSLFFVRSMALTGYEKYDATRGILSNLLRTDLGGRIQFPFLWQNFREYRRAARTATVTIANSSHTAEQISELFGVDTEVVYPPIELDEYRVEYDPDGSILMVNPRAEYKGADIFLDIASELPDERFRLVGPIASSEIASQARKMENVSHTQWCDDMRTAYASAKLVVVPSRWEEPFGRVPAEAMVSGIPCVVSDRGGLPEVVGETGAVVTDIESTTAWIDAIERALAEHSPAAQQNRVQKFSAETQTETLLKLIDGL
ncbi:glycosyltransferase family 4 protein [Haloarcula sp. GH36]|uniref:glycosyltransferase family 4 protein n=1 Tax=Haloarcula montana TaxID=3111776 RepID=UPI002D7A1601|nr:glycosyltransferase family 4 protein [Haloarcula sp. GH36]